MRKEIDGLDVLGGLFLAAFLTTVVVVNGTKKPVKPKQEKTNEPT